LIALIQIALGSRFLLRPDDEFPLVSWEGDVEGIGRVKAVVYPPYQSELSTSTFRVGDAVPLINDFEKLNPATPQVTPLIEIDGTPVVECDAIAVEFHAVDLDRTPGRSGPLIELALSVVNDFINRIRVLTRASHLRPLEFESTSFHLAFLDDARERLPKEEGKVGGVGKVGFRLRHVAITPDAWRAIAELGAYEPPPWDILLLDALDLDTDIGPALVLAAAAVETRIATALAVLAEGKMPEELWEWIAKRDGDYTKTPSVREQLDVLLAELAGKSLKEDQRLWEGGVHLRDARNSFVHQGQALIGKRPPTSVTRAKARELVVIASEIIDFVEALLPAAERRPRLDTLPSVTTTVPLALAADGPSDDQDEIHTAR
jgi:hypothetical protein